MNPKTKFALFSICFIAVLLVTTLGVAKVAPNSDMAEYKAQAQRDFDNAKTAIEQIRGVKMPFINLQVVTKQWAIETWGKGYADPDITNILRQEKFYKGVFLIPENASLYQANVDWAGNFGAATWGEQIYVVKENFDPWDLPNAEATFVHELTHIWQPHLVNPDSFDMDKAHGALVEGDASYMGDFFINQTKASPAPELTVNQVPFYLLTNPALTQIHLMPDAIWSLNYFPYDQGKTFLTAVFQNGGWKTVNSVYQNPPNTTAQILHPEQYFANQTNQPVNAPTLAENSWTQIKNDRYGEYFIQVMLKNWVPATEAKNASTGWVGDNYTYYERSNDYLFTWNIKWGSSCDASDFYVAFHNMAIAAGATDYGSCNWAANGRYLSITWDQSQNTTLVACSNVQAATQADYFTQK